TVGPTSEEARHDVLDSGVDMTRSIDLMHLGGGIDRRDALADAEQCAGPAARAGREFQTASARRTIGPHELLHARVVPIGLQEVLQRIVVLDGTVLSRLLSIERDLVTDACLIVARIVDSAVPV